MLSLLKCVLPDGAHVVGIYSSKTTFSPSEQQKLVIQSVLLKMEISNVKWHLMETTERWKQPEVRLFYVAVFLGHKHPILRTISGVKLCQKGSMSYCESPWVTRRRRAILWGFITRAIQRLQPLKFGAPAPRSWHQTRWLLISRRQCGVLGGCLSVRCVVSCCVLRIWRFVVSLKHLWARDYSYPMQTTEEK